MTEPTDAEILELASQYWECLDETESATEIELVRAALAKWGTPPTVAADSVLEDAARYRMLRRGQHWSVINGVGDTLRAEELDAAIDAARSKAKEGQSHD